VQAAGHVGDAGGLLAHGTQGRRSGAPRGAVDDEHTVEVVVLVLDDAGLEALGAEVHRLAVLVQAAYAQADGALHRHGHAGHAQAALVGLLDLVRELVQDRVDQHARVVIHVVDQETLQDADLRRGEADSRSVVHSADHTLGQLAQAAVELGDVVRVLTQHGVADDADVLAGLPHAARELLLVHSVCLYRVAHDVNGTSSRLHIRRASEPLGLHVGDDPDAPGGVPVAVRRQPVAQHI
jgi:hypothetical protein